MHLNVGRITGNVKHLSKGFARVFVNALGITNFFCSCQSRFKQLSFISEVSLTVHRRLLLSGSARTATDSDNIDDLRADPTLSNTY